MSARLTRLLDIEKYLLAEMVYFHLPSELARRDFEKFPLPLSELLELIPWCEFGGSNQKGADKTDSAFMRRNYLRIRRCYDEQPQLHDIKLTGYINDNYGRFTNTDSVRKTSFVGMAFRDDSGSGVVVFSGCEINSVRPMLMDYGGCFVAMLGMVTEQHRIALKFYDRQMKGLTGERGVIGHSKGGNLATYVFVNRLSEPLSAYCINAQPYCWWILTEKQRAALKSSRYEFIVHEGDVVSRTGYASYVSRVAYVNPYLNRRQVVSLHGFSSMKFDSMGNLEGKRILRTTQRKLSSRLFGDYLEEAPPGRDEVVKNFKMLMSWDVEPARLLAIAMEELLFATKVDTVILMLRIVGSPEDTLYVYQTRGEGAPLLRNFRMRLTKNDALIQTVAKGLPVYVASTERYEQHYAPINNVLGWSVNSACAVPVMSGDKPWFGMLELLCKDKRLTVEDFELGVDLAELIGQLQLRITRESEKLTSPMMLLERLGAPIIALERHGIAQVHYRFENERAAYRRIFREGLLSDDEVMTFDGWVMRAGDETLLQNWRKKSVAMIDRSDAGVPQFLLKSRDTSDAAQKENAAELMGFSGMSTEKLWLKARETVSESADEAEILRARVALALISRPQLIVCDVTDCAPEAARELSAYLKLLCYDKLVSAIIIKPEPQG